LNAHADHRYYLDEMLAHLDSLSPPQPGVTDLWRMPLHGSTRAQLAILSPAERARHHRLHGPRRDRFALAHGAMRRILARYMGCRPEAVALWAPAGRAPSVHGLRLSLSHCPDLALLALSADAVGVDVEQLAIAQDEDLSALAELTLSPRERAAFQRTSEADRPAAWLRAWTRREAVVKARPGALSDLAISELDVSETPVLDLALQDLDVGPAHVAALATTAPTPQVVLREWVE
jgi:4'-phosphopantetheinyl transferase